MSIENILAADKSGSFPAVQAAVMEYYQSNKGLTFQDIERELRKTDCNAFLIARSRRAAGDQWVSYVDGNVKTNFPQKMKFLDMRTREERKYFLWLTTKRGPALMKELLEESVGYEDNFAKLADCGVQVLDTDGDAPVSIPSGQCVRCGLPDTTRCGDCDVVTYCSPACRRADWTFHGRHCRSMVTLPNWSSKSFRDRTVRDQAIRKKYEGTVTCCEVGRRNFTHGANMVGITRGGRKAVVCEGCLARVGVENRERGNIVHTRIVGNPL